MESLQSKDIGSQNQTNSLDYYCVFNVVWSIFSIPCACVGVPASVWLLWVLVQRQRTGLSNDLYMLNLTIMDLIFNISIVPGIVNNFLGKNFTFSRIISFLYSFNIAGRPQFMACICVDCYMAVVYPITYMNLKQSRHRFVSTVFVFALTLCYGMGMTLSAKSLFAMYFLSVIPYVVAVPIIAFCDVAILCTLRQPDPSGKREVHPQKQKALQAVTNSLVMTVAAYLPPIMILSMSPLISSDQERMCFVLYPSMCSPLLGSTLMPLMYLENLGKLKGLNKCV